jgi:hypothetical protein
MQDYRKARQAQAETARMEQEQISMAAQREEAARKLLSENPNATQAQIFGILGPKAGSDFLKARSEQQIKDIELQGAGIARIAAVANTMTDENTYRSGVTQLLNEGRLKPEEAEQYLAAGWNPETQARVKQVAQQALTVAQQLEQARQQEAAKLNERKFVYQQENDAAQRDVTLRGQDLTAETSRRGQDISAETTRRGQDISATTAREGHRITSEGQRLSAATQRRGQDMTAATAHDRLVAEGAQFEQQADLTRRGQDIGAKTASDRLKAQGATTTGGRVVPGSLRKNNPKFVEAQLNIENMKDALGKYKDALTNITFTQRFNPRSKELGNLESLYTDVTMQLKNLHALGALTGPDLEVLQRQLRNPMSPMGILSGKDYLAGQIEALEGALTRTEDNLRKQHGVPTAPAADKDPLGIR